MEDKQTDQNLNLDKRIHKILDSIRSKKEPMPTPEQAYKKDSYRSSSSHSNQNKSLEKEGNNVNNTFERSTTDTMHSLSKDKTDSIKYEKKDNYTTQTSTNISQERSTSESRDSQDSKNLSDKFKAKRNIINCANKTDQKEDANRP